MFVREWLLEEKGADASIDTRRLPNLAIGCEPLLIIYGTWYIHTFFSSLHFHGLCAFVGRNDNHEQ